MPGSSRTRNAAQSLLHGPDMIGQASSHGWGRGLPLRGRSVVVCGWERGWEALSSTAVWDNAPGGRQRLVLLTSETVARARDTTEHAHDPDKTCGPEEG